MENFNKLALKYLQTHEIKDQKICERMPQSNLLLLNFCYEVSSGSQHPIESLRFPAQQILLTTILKGTAKPQKIQIIYTLNNNSTSHFCGTLQFTEHFHIHDLILILVSYLPYLVFFHCTILLSVGAVIKVAANISLEEAFSVIFVQKITPKLFKTEKGIQQISVCQLKL